MNDAKKSVAVPRENVVGRKVDLDLGLVRE